MQVEKNIAISSGLPNEDEEELFGKQLDSFVIVTDED